MRLGQEQIDYRYTTVTRCKQDIEILHLESGGPGTFGKISLPREQVLAPVKNNFELLRGIFRNEGLA